MQTSKFEQLTPVERRALADSFRMFELISYSLDAFPANDPTVEALRSIVKNGQTELDGFFPPLDLDRLSNYDVIQGLQWATRQPETPNVQKLINMSVILGSGHRLNDEDMKLALLYVKAWQVARLANNEF